METDLFIFRSFNFNECNYLFLPDTISKNKNFTKLISKNNSINVIIL